MVAVAARKPLVLGGLHLRPDFLGKVEDDDRLLMGALVALPNGTTIQRRSLGSTFTRLADPALLAARQGGGVPSGHCAGARALDHQRN